MLLKFESVLWGDGIDLLVDIVDATDDIAKMGDMKVMDRPWAKDKAFTEIGVYTEKIEIARRLVEVFGGRIWVMSPKSA